MPKIVTHKKSAHDNILNSGLTNTFWGDNMCYRDKDKISGVTKKFIGNLKICGQQPKYLGSCKNVWAHV